MEVAGYLVFWSVYVPCMVSVIITIVVDGTDTKLSVMPILFGYAASCGKLTLDPFSFDQLVLMSVAKSSLTIDFNNNMLQLLNLSSLLAAIIVMFEFSINFISYCGLPTICCSGRYSIQNSSFRPNHKELVLGAWCSEGCQWQRCSRDGATSKRSEEEWRRRGRQQWVGLLWCQSGLGVSRWRVYFLYELSNCLSPPRNSPRNWLFLSNPFFNICVYPMSGCWNWSRCGGDEERGCGDVARLASSSSRRSGFRNTFEQLEIPVGIQRPLELDRRDEEDWSRGSHACPTILANRILKVVYWRRCYFYTVHGYDRSVTRRHCELWVTGQSSRISWKERYFVYKRSKQAFIYCIYNCFSWWFGNRQIAS